MITKNASEELRQQVSSQNIVFDPVEHVYHVDGVKAISVTQALEMAGIAKQYRGDKKYADWGTAVHSAIEAILSGNDVPEFDDKEVENPVAAFRKWRKENKNLSPILLEHKVSHGHDDGYIAGTIDAVFRDEKDGGVYVVDWKTSSKPSYSHIAQVSMYKEMLEANTPVDGVIVVYLNRETGDYTEERHEPIDGILEKMSGYLFEFIPLDLPGLKVEIPDDMVEERIEIRALEEDLKHKKKAVEEKIRDFLDGRSGKSEMMTVSYVKPTSSMKFHEKSFREMIEAEMPYQDALIVLDILERSKKEVTRQGSYRYSFK